MTEHEITKKQFLFFKKRCAYWVNKLGLVNWRIYYHHTDDVLNDGFADVTTNLRDRSASICLNVKINFQPTNTALDKCALHECLHILLRRMKDTLIDRNEHDYEDAIHEVIRTLENVLIK